MRILVLSLMLMSGIATPSLLAGQNRDVRRDRLQEEVIRRFMENYRSQAGLDDEQYTRFRDVAQQAFEARNAFNRRERTVWRALEGQMRPGVAADPDSVTQLLDTLVDLQGERVARVRAEQEEFATFLSPVQRAQLTLALRRLQNQIERVLQQRLQGRDLPRRP